MLPKTGLSPIGTVRPLRVNCHDKTLLHWQGNYFQELQQML
jgi:hypothetical protein